MLSCYDPAAPHPEEAAPQGPASSSHQPTQGQIPRSRKVSPKKPRTQGAPSRDASPGPEAAAAAAMEAADPKPWRRNMKKVDQGGQRWQQAVAAQKDDMEKAAKAAGDAGDSPSKKQKLEKPWRLNMKKVEAVDAKFLDAAAKQAEEREKVRSCVEDTAQSHDTRVLYKYCAQLQVFHTKCCP
jgi:hypothetical protein